MTRCHGNAVFALKQRRLSSPDRLLVQEKRYLSYCDIEIVGAASPPLTRSNKSTTNATHLFRQFNYRVTIKFNANSFSAATSYPFADLDLAGFGFLDEFGRFDGEVLRHCVVFNAVNSGTSAPTLALRAVHSWDSDVSANINATVLYNLAPGLGCWCPRIFFQDLAHYLRCRSTPLFATPTLTFSTAQDPRISNVVLQPSAQPSVNFAADGDFDLTELGFIIALGHVGDEYNRSEQRRYRCCARAASVSLLGSRRLRNINATLQLVSPDLDAGARDIQEISRYLWRLPTPSLATLTYGCTIVRPSHPFENPLRTLRPSAQPSAKFAADGDLDLMELGFMHALGRLGHEFAERLDIRFNRSEQRRYRRYARAASFSLRRSRHLFWELYATLGAMVSRTREPCTTYALPVSSYQRRIDPRAFDCRDVLDDLSLVLKRAVPDIEGDSAALAPSFGWTVSLIVCAAVVVANALPTRLKHDGHVDVTAPLWLKFTAAIFLPTIYRNEHDVSRLGLRILLWLAWYGVALGPCLQLGRHGPTCHGFEFGTTSFDDLARQSPQFIRGLAPSTLSDSRIMHDSSMLFGGVVFVTRPVPFGFAPTGYVFCGALCPISRRSCTAYASLTCRMDDYKMNQWVDPVRPSGRLLCPTPRLKHFSMAAASFIVGLRHLGLHLGVSDNNTSPSAPRLCLD
ncbi:hypothetical protein BDZ89DRAFT_1137291 [Hymenopellis radicata]|nr:hypothetical protein BDZ89DRAFT_1137291 [Hymenopellis radicata]